MPRRICTGGSKTFPLQTVATPTLFLDGCVLSKLVTVGNSKHLFIGQLSCAFEVDSPIKIAGYSEAKIMWGEKAGTLNRF